MLLHYLLLKIKVLVDSTEQMLIPVFLDVRKESLLNLREFVISWHWVDSSQIVSNNSREEIDKLSVHLLDCQVTLKPIEHLFIFLFEITYN